MKWKLLLASLIVAAGTVKADTLPLSGTLHLPGDSITYNLTIQTSIDNNYYCCGGTELVALLSGTFLEHTGNFSSITTVFQEYFRGINEPAQSLWEFAAYKPYCFLADSEYCPPPPDSALIKKFDLELFSIDDARWIETDGHDVRNAARRAARLNVVSTPEPSVLWLLVLGTISLVLGWVYNRKPSRREDEFYYVHPERKA